MGQEIYILFLVIILIIIMYLSMLTYSRTHGRTFHEDIMPSMYTDIFPEDEFKGGNEYMNRVSMMRNVVLNENLVIGGLIYNMEEDKVLMLEKRINYISDGWKSVTIMIYGLDSKEPYSGYLIDWSKRDKRVKLIDSMKGVSWKNKNVFVKMSHLRNRVHESLNSINTKDTFFLSMDYDIGGPISRDGLLHARYLLEDNTLGAVYANGIVSDSLLNCIPGLKGWCFPGLGYSYYDDLALKISGDDESKLYKWFSMTSGRGTKYKEVLSAYGGAGLMRLKVAKDMRYDEANTVCEHYGFNKSIRDNGLKIIVDPSFILLAGCQGHHITRKVD